MDPHALRNFKDFLLLYNKISENCFLHCVNDLSCRNLTSEEQACVEKCAYKHVKMNNRAMQVYMEVQPTMTQRRIDEMQRQAEAQRAKLEAEEIKTPTDSSGRIENLDTGS